MADITVARESALAGHLVTGQHGKAGTVGVQLSEAKDLVLCQVAAWPDTVAGVGAKLAAFADSGASMPGFGQSLFSANGSAGLLRTEPLKFWVVGSTPPEFEASQAVSVDLSHSRTLIRLKGVHATTLLNSYLPLDLRDSAFPIGSVGSTAFHHCGVTLWRLPEHYALFLPRGFALSLWEMLMEGALQHGVEVVE
jgi:heterotetrameric sarcosine oxidase gamma subunit